MEILKVENLVKSYGRLRVLDGISFSLLPGRILGLIGPNGAGKSTLLKILAGLLRLDSGKVTIGVFSVGTRSKALVSYLHDSNPLFSWMRAEDAIDYYADFFEDFDRKRATEILAFMKLDKTQKVKTMSKGMTEKLNLTLAFARAAKLYLLDEPLGGIDPLARRNIVATIIQAFRPDSSIIISTHLLNDIEHMFHDVVFIHRGKILLTEDVSHLRENNMTVEQLYVQTYSAVEEQL